MRWALCDTTHGVISGGFRQDAHTDKWNPLELSLHRNHVFRTGPPFHSKGYH